MTVNAEETCDTMDTDKKVNGPSHAEEVPNIDDQCQEITQYLQKALQKGETWYLIDSRWFKQWQKYVGNTYPYEKGKETSFPGPIDNTSLFADITKSDDLKNHLMEGVDYELLPVEAWESLLNWYGMVDGSVPVPRIVQEHGQYVKSLKVEVYLTKLKLCRNSDMKDCVAKKFSKNATLADVMKAIRTAFDISDDKDIRIWNKYMSSTYELLKDPDLTIQDSELYDGQVVLMEEKNEDGTWPRQTRSSSISGINGPSSSMDSPSSTTEWSYNSPSSTGFPSSYGYSYGTSYGSYNDDSRRRSSSGSWSASRAGLCGLSNLGNTCFMNSSLQCLSNTHQLTKYFLAGNYKQELNPQNPLGMRGEVAKAYAELMHQIWSGYHSFVSPRNFKMVVGRFAPQFSGYQQQDSHELLAFLLDGLHEDLNRVKKKPYVEIPDHGGRPDKELAEEAWVNHQKRNCSIIVDLFHGLFKSTVMCPECSKVSVTFDPFCYLSLPLPEAKERYITLVFVPLETERKPLNMKVLVPKHGTVDDLTLAISELTGTDRKKMLIADVYNHRFHKIFERRDTLSHINDSDSIYAYELPISTDDTRDSELIIVPVYLRINRYQPVNSYSYGSHSLFGTPMLVTMPRNRITYKDLYQIMYRALRRLMKQPPEEDCSEEVEKPEEVNGASSEDDEEKIKDDGNSRESDKDDVEMKTPEQESRSKANKDLFTIKSVNSYGTADLDTFYDDDSDLKITSRMYLALDWEPSAKKYHYNEDAAEDTENHPSIKEKPPKKTAIQLQDCLELFLTREKLGAEDPWYCPCCKTHRQAFKKFDLWGLPPVLVIHLKRFSFNRRWRDKIDSLVEFPLRDLSLTPYVIDKEHPPAVYDLTAVSNHYGGMGGGHYTAYAKNLNDGKWYYFDDSSVSTADEDRIVSKAAYVLFYARRKDPMHPQPPGNDLLSDDENAVFPTQDESSDEGEHSMET